MTFETAFMRDAAVTTITHRLQTPSIAAVGSKKIMPNDREAVKGYEHLNAQK